MSEPATPSSATSGPLLDVDLRLSVSDGPRRFDLAVSFATRAPVVALYGPSGAGKSMTLQALAGLLRPQAGHIRLGTRTWFDATAGVHVPPQRRGLGYLFQDYALFPHLKVRENIEFGLRAWWPRRLPAADRERVDALIDGMGLRPLLAARPADLSGGQRQRVALARALACEPALLLLDEPFAALNPMLRSRLREDLARLRAQWQIPIVMITHDVDDVLALADLALVIEHGQVSREVDVRGGASRERVQALVQGDDGPDAATRAQAEQLHRLLVAGAPAR